MGVPIQEVVLLQSRNSPLYTKVAPEVRRTFSALLTTAIERLTSWLAGEFYKRNGLVCSRLLERKSISISVPLKYL